MQMGLDKAKQAQFKAQVVKLIGDPVKMRLAVVFAVTGLVVGAVYYPLSGRIDETRGQVSSERQRLATIQEVESLRHDVKAYQSRIGAQSDANEWVQYLLAGSRRAGVGLRSMETRDPRKVGPYTAVALTLEVQGVYPQLKEFVEWLEQSDRLLRVESVRLEKAPGMVVMKIYILGVVRSHA
ncbi:MAG: GspMb/PilO family protein [Planctomycetota bacterium]|nr:GspMb/PilO family protein [Planctomycetota bacterium]